ncbi:RNA 2',3'-cyclic phosphodiesterase [Candidatus Uhrbacteria bacterium CG_4_9_14_3_um_filter_36_7]|uniref:RNA 2',3'-cyclic phosphodiesterase n=1 Tax=Candidatus Uhrbacteria bacterium CG_4_9_14_3_um_filter_36_7 TaxID=1975033 RepID=A0A2M7XIW4_9BACT|nr:MAG: RNA 2',3'-cyclic phosphodiesterase [Candidatus Uhrbacteria bacterium CG_4_9_14_3_um_filter_36_7]
MSRLFFALPLPWEIKSAVGQVQEQVKQQMKYSRINWVDPDLFHITLHFLGDVEDERREELVRLCQEKKIWPKPFELVLTSLNAFPNLKNPQTIFIETNIHPSLLHLRKQLADILFSSRFDLDLKQWHSHITIGRTKVLAETICPEKIQVEPLKFYVNFFVLMESNLRSTGPIYSPVEEFKL